MHVRCICHAYTHVDGHVTSICILSYQEAWFELFVIRATTMKLIKGGLQAVLSGGLRLFFPEHGHNLMTAGMSVKLHNGGGQHFWMQLGPIIADEAAEHGMFSCKGSAGLKPCLLCVNVFNAKYRREGITTLDIGGMTMMHHEHDVSKMVLHSRASIAACIAKLSVPMSVAARKEMETNLGWNYVPDGILHDPYILNIAHPVEHVLFDWMHVFFVTGVWNAMVYVLCMALDPLGIKVESFEQFVSSWKAPKRLKHFSFAKVFQKKRWTSSREAKHCKSTASEGLCLLQLLAAFMAAIMEGGRCAATKAHARCYLMLTHIVELLMRNARECIDGRLYTAAARDFLKLYHELHGEATMTPKFHSVLHFGAFVQRWGKLPNCFALERKHRLAKRCATPWCECPST